MLKNDLNLLHGRYGRVIKNIPFERGGMSRGSVVWIAPLTKQSNVMYLRKYGTEDTRTPFFKADASYIHHIEAIDPEIDVWKTYVSKPDYNKNVKKKSWYDRLFENKLFRIVVTIVMLPFTIYCYRADRSKERNE